MSHSAVRPLPLGRSNFSVLRLKNCIYVDKTDLLSKLCENDDKVFLARPRRFGKSLLVSAFESLFRYGLREFEGLKIEQTWTDRTYNVIRLDFSLTKDFSSVSEFLSLLNGMFGDAVSEAGLSILNDADDPVGSFRTMLSRQPLSSLVLLIDEYDAPLTAHLDNTELLEGVQQQLSRFYAAVKSHDGCLRFFFMTGITKFSNTSIFSSFNNLLDISLNPIYGTVLGYTEEEIIEYFEPFLVSAERTLNLSRQECLAQLRDHYDGFSFDISAQNHVYCPWSVLNFFKFPSLGFQNYWYASAGQPSVLMKYLAAHSLEKPLAYSAEKTVLLSDLSGPRQYSDISPNVLLTQAGYLTIRAVRNNTVLLGYPNREVADSLAALYAEELLKGQSIEPLGKPSIADVMAGGSLDEIVSRFNDAVNAVDYLRYPISDEATCRAYLQVLLIGAAMMPHVEVHSALGRSDLETDAGTRHWVFEFKYAEDDSQADAKLQQGEQQIRSRRYGQSDRMKCLMRAVLVFSAAQRQFVRWKLTDGDF